MPPYKVIPLSQNWWFQCPNFDIIDQKTLYVCGLMTHDHLPYAENLVICIHMIQNISKLFEKNHNKSQPTYCVICMRTTITLIMYNINNQTNIHINLKCVRQIVTNLDSLFTLDTTPLLQKITQNHTWVMKSYFTGSHEALMLLQ